MSIVPLKKLTLFGLSNEKEQILKRLQKLGCLHLVSLRAAPDRPEDILPQYPKDTHEALRYLLDSPMKRRPVTEDEDFELAAQVYEQLLEAEPGDQEIWEPLLDVYRKLGAKQKLVALIDQTVTLVDSVGARGRLRLEQAHVLLRSCERYWKRIRPRPTPPSCCPAFSRRQDATKSSSIC